MGGGAKASRPRGRANKRVGRGYGEVRRVDLDFDREDVRDLVLSSTFAPLGCWLSSGVVSALLIASLTLPYARPLACDAEDHEANTLTHLNREASSGSQVTGERPCHASMDCCVVPAAPATDGPDVIALYQHPSTESPIPALTPLSTVTSPLTPPPKV